jgi:predicted alpha-1,2-mannosidase
MKFLFSILFTFVLYQLSAQHADTNVDFVDPTIGGVGVLLVPTRPTVQLPNSMVRVFPFKKDQLDDQISYFPLTISSHRHTHLFSILPFSGEINDSIWNQRRTYDQEKTFPYYYSTTFEDSQDSLAFAPGARAGLFRFYFNSEKKHYLRLKVINEGEISTEGKRIVKGIEQFKGMKAFFYGKIDSDIEKVIYRSTNDKKAALIKVGSRNKIVNFKYGISFISIEQAKQNLEKEIVKWDFENLKKKAKSEWSKVLSQIKVEGGTEAQKKIFYTALYRCYERMININEDGKYYSAYDHQVHSSADPFFVDNWIWDTYIAMEPLFAILNPELQNQKIQSYIKMYEQSDWMPSFALLYGDYPVMTGNHVAPWILDSWIKGIRKYDLKRAYEGLAKNSLQGTLLPYRNGPSTPLDSFYNKNGYMPSLRPDQKETYREVHDFEKRQSVSVTQENSFDDWCLAQLAGELGKKNDQELFLKRAGYYKNLFREEKASVWPKDEMGKWIEPFDPKFSGGQGGRDYFTENTAYTYDWNVKHDLDGLFELMGGKLKAEEKLDNLFREDLGRSKYKFWAVFPDATGLVGQFSMGNEPSFHIPYLYNYLGSPWKTQKRIRMLMETYFTDNVFGIPGDEDGGGMSAFVMFSMMGFFPVTPGIPAYTIGSPVFDKISIELPNGKSFSVITKNNSKENKYIQKITLNGSPLTKTFFTHEDILKGNVLEIEMGNHPNKSWGTIDAAPPSSINYKPLRER